TDKGKTWESDQTGLPYGKYSFQLVEQDDAVLLGQWNGIYKKSTFENWELIKGGLPDNIPVTEMKTYRNLVIAASSSWKK
ncbi:MAG TPA: hypothetical protein VKA27_00550, partial [Sunxiuqinia sp.]|nr:hypothetical protein [Sunxiuqinia sp.]